MLKNCVPLKQKYFIEDHIVSSNKSANQIPGFWHAVMLASSCVHSPVNLNLFWYAKFQTPSKLDRQFFPDGLTALIKVRINLEHFFSKTFLTEHCYQLLVIVQVFADIFNCWPPIVVH